MSRNFSYVMVLGGGLLLGFAAAHFWMGDHEVPAQAMREDTEPLYWVAPMDANFRRDAPGKSPMGMDLVPVYAQASEPGVVEVSARMVNSLGVRTARASLAPLHEMIEAVGYVKYSEDRLIHIHPRVEGWIEKLHVTAAGNPVSRGAPIYALYSPQLVNAQEELVSAIRRDNPVLLDAARSRLAALQLDAGFIADLEDNREVRQTVTFTAPQSGVVDQLDVREGFYVGPDSTLMSIASLDEMWVEAQVFESQAALVQAGQRVSMRLDYLPGREWSGEVDYVYPSLDAETRTLRVRLRFANEDRVLKPNMFGHVRIHAGGEGAVLSVPREALIRTAMQDRVVLALGDGEFKSVAVTAGRITNRRAEILEGIGEGDEVVVSAQFLLDSESNIEAELARIAPSAKSSEKSGVDHDMSGHEGHVMEPDMGHDMSGHDMSEHDAAGHEGREMEPDMEHEMSGYEGHVMEPDMGHDMSGHDMSEHDAAGHEGHAIEPGMEHDMSDHAGMAGEHSRHSGKSMPDPEAMPDHPHDAMPGKPDARDGGS